MLTIQQAVKAYEIALLNRTLILQKHSKNSTLASKPIHPTVYSRLGHYNLLLGNYAKGNFHFFDSIFQFHLLQLCLLANASWNWIIIIGWLVYVQSNITCNLCVCVHQGFIIFVHHWPCLFALQCIALVSPVVTTCLIMVHSNLPLLSCDYPRLIIPIVFHELCTDI